MQSKVDTIAEAMPAISDDNANTIILLLLNQSATETDNFITQLHRAAGNAASQQSVLASLASRLDKDGMLVPAPGDVQYVVDPVRREMKDGLSGFSCLCSLDAFKELLALYGKLVNE